MEDDYSATVRVFSDLPRKFVSAIFPLVNSHE